MRIGLLACNSIKHMQKTGIVKALEEAGINEGDTVRIGDVEWEWD